MNESLEHYDAGGGGGGGQEGANKELSSCTFPANSH